MQQFNIMELLTEHFQAGGDIMIALLLLSLIMWTLAIYKSLRFFRESNKELSPAKCLEMYENEPQSCKIKLPVWQFDILSEHMDANGNDPDLNRELLKSIRVRHEFTTMCNIGTILILAAAAPLLGLLGTVTGMISTFDVIAQFGTGNARALASGISEALVTTQSGLVAAVPGLILGGILLRKGEKLKSRMELFCICLQEQTDSLSTQKGIAR
ncbi:MotA/TolQ/ExbB proton channel family protein [Maridesulfovibrio sp.]|uniref:MotA/TolQ/ExbB proton channel family protein n=1 Tax=Maridesulfovibrio sp. TaxID=2795000 RepID=UPI002A18E66C|nr:MotA/TolQ/ExbB proton channel family protein [Maridesulfovibrio sp.]